MKLIILVLKLTPPLHPNPSRQGLMKKALSSLRLSTPTNIEVAKDVINVSQPEPELRPRLYRAEGNNEKCKRWFHSIVPKKIKKGQSVCVYVSVHNRACISRGGVYVALISACQMQNEFCYGWGICSAPQWVARSV